ncbi:hypothetical protein [Gordonia aichiensis]|uniref:Uncharacterized protein n=1 Tax=Gordonia aichiensis NBRC 108223 TaxID=1220583 RepID=L7KFV4_9ACTN|nr:hypothetical protein [Gordonia aichiensis]GAC47464.1 hypothetical protein GOACH_03_04850 [Gordonia aichiensis NBRC 108223]
MVHRHDGPEHSAHRSDDDAAKAAAEEVVAKIEQAEAAADKAPVAMDTAPDSAAASEDNGPSDESGDTHRTRHRRDWRHIPRTRIRTSTALVSVLFIVCVVLYGYTSQRYGIVDPPAPQPARHRTTVQTTPESTYSTPPSSSYPSTTGPSETTGESGTESVAPGGQTAPGQSGQPTTTRGNGFSDFFNRNQQQNEQQNETTAVPSR